MAASAFAWGDGASGFLSVGGKRLEALWLGPPPDRAPTLVMLHEGLGCVALWRDFPARLAAATGFGVFAYSRAGYGRSDPVPLPRPLDYLMHESRVVLPVVLGAIGFRRGVLVGHSDGSSIAAIAAAEPDAKGIEGIVMLAPHVLAEDFGGDALEETKRAYASGELKSRLAKYHAHVDCAFYGWCDAWLDPGMRAWSIEDCVPRWRAPALAILGADDQYFSIRQIRAIGARATAPVKTLVLEDCRHAPQFEQPEATLDAIARFCKSTLQHAA